MHGLIETLGSAHRVRRLAFGGLLAAISAAAVVASGASAQDTITQSGPQLRCCHSKFGPEPVPNTGKWLPGTFMRAKCLAGEPYRFWDGDTPNLARKVCARKPSTPPVPPNCRWCHDDPEKAPPLRPGQHELPKGHPPIDE